MPVPKSGLLDDYIEKPLWNEDSLTIEPDPTAAATFSLASARETASSSAISTATVSLSPDLPVDLNGYSTSSTTIALIMFGPFNLVHAPGVAYFVPELIG